MNTPKTIRGWKDKILFTPGPLTTSQTVKSAMLRDLGSRDFAFIEAIRTIRQHLLNIAGVNKGDYEAVPMQGSGTFAIEAVLSSTIPQDGKLLVVINGAYGKRIHHMAKVLKIDVDALTYPENTPPKPADVEEKLANDSAITHVAVIHCETTTGMMNPIQEIGKIVKKHTRIFFVDAMSSFGAVPIDFNACHIDYLVSSANKCIEGVPGFAFAICRNEVFLKTEGYARSLSLDLYSQWKGLESNGQFRFTPPTHTLLAFHQALLELQEEGGVEARANRYRTNYETLVAGMRKLGFQEYLPAELQGYIITSFLFPTHPNFKFETFYEALNQKDQVIYPGKVSDADCFRIGNIGRIFPSDVQTLLGAMQQTLEELQIKL
jgi:2-aminoethylphosphonate-pyruvate transaminase